MLARFNCCFSEPSVSEPLVDADQSIRQIPKNSLRDKQVVPGPIEIKRVQDRRVPEKGMRFLSLMWSY